MKAVIPALSAAAASIPLQAYNVSQIARTTPAAMPAGQALEELGDAFDKRVNQFNPGRASDIELVLEQNTPTKSPLKTFLERDTSKYSSSSRTDEPGVYKVSINPNADRSYLAHELGHIASDQTKMGNMIRSARSNPKLAKSLLAASVLGAGGAAALTPGDEDMATSVALAYAGSIPTIADEILATKNGLAMMDTAGMRASLGQRGRMAAGLTSYLATPLLVGAGLNFAGNLVDEDQQTMSTVPMN